MSVRDFRGTPPELSAPRGPEGGLVKQQCTMANIYLSWAIYLGGLVLVAWKVGYWGALFWLVGVPLAQWAYIRGFPRVSRYLGYGRVDDEQPESVRSAAVKVTR